MGSCYLFSQILEFTRLNGKMIDIEDPQWTETLVAWVFVSKNATEEQMEGRQYRPHLPPGSREEGTGGNPRDDKHDKGLPTDPRLVG